MKKTIQILGILLALQLLLAFALQRHGSELAAGTGGAPLLAADTASIDHIAIDGTDPNGGTGKVELKKSDGKWTYADGDLAGKEANGTKVKQMLDKLKAIHLGTPVATRKEALARFQLGKDNYLRRIELGSGGKSIATIYFGKRIGLDQMHLRRNDEQDVYTGIFNIFDAPLKAEDWKAPAKPAEAKKQASPDAATAAAPAPGKAPAAAGHP